MRGLGQHMVQNLDLMEDSRAFQQVHSKLYLFHPTLLFETNEEVQSFAPRLIEKPCSLFPSGSSGNKELSHIVITCIVSLKRSPTIIFLDLFCIMKAANL
jgi:hypothetical protein